MLEPERRTLTSTREVSVRALVWPFYWLLVFPLSPKYVDYGKANNSSLQLVSSTGQMFNRLLLEITG